MRLVLIRRSFVSVLSSWLDFESSWSRRSHPIWGSPSRVYWMAQADVDDGRRPGLSSDERAELVRLTSRARSAFHAWRHAQANPTARMLADSELGDLVVKIHEQSFGTYSDGRVTAEMRLGFGRKMNHRRVERLMRERGLQGDTRRRRGKGCIRSQATDRMHAELVADATDMATWRRRHRKERSRTATLDRTAASGSSGNDSAVPGCSAP
jgi:hypothetical protein